MKTLAYRLNPTPPQERQMFKALGSCRWVYNWALADRKRSWEEDHESATFYSQSNQLPDLKKVVPFLGSAHAHLLQTALKRVDLAYQAFFRRVKAGEKPGYPRFKGRFQYDSFTFKEWGNGAKLSGSRLCLTKIGLVRIHLHRPVEGRVKTCTIKHRADGWYALLSVETPTVEPSAVDNPVGIDLGITTFATLSTGEEVPNPRTLQHAEVDLRRAQRVVSRRKKGSHRRLKARQILAREHLHVERVRKDFHFKLACLLVATFNPIIVENLDVKQMQVKREIPNLTPRQSRGLRRNIGDVAWAQFLSILEHKAESAGVQVVRVDPRGTTKQCSQCGASSSKTLRERKHVCPSCGFTLGRDLNAARNILQRGRTVPSGRIACVPAIH